MSSPFSLLAAPRANRLLAAKGMGMAPGEGGERGLRACGLAGLRLGGSGGGRELHGEQGSQSTGRLAGSYS